jgi:hypothetical protein
MSFTPLSTLRRRPTRRAVTVLAAVALFLAGFVQAAHYHKDETARSAQTHLQCLLCLHVDRWAGAPEPPKSAAPVATAHAPIVVHPVSFESVNCFHCYDARGPPLV